ncbi:MULTISPECIES: DEAD/DEAH box helicase [unclassified Collinsella]|uniref:DEAD/DEAH box helicase n=1 Tax=unclassified Collinsella TaxID=2637548 RepID=UPI00319E602B
MTQSTTPGDVVAFSGLGLSEPVLAAVDALGYTEPTPVQARAIPYVLEGRDLLAAAQTGTGKTAAFVLPSMSRLTHVARHHGPAMLVVTPTRELAQQIADVCTTVEAYTHHRSVTIVGGVGYEPQKQALRRGCDILVATPGRLVDLIEQGEAHLDEVEVLVLDEADRMLDMGFLPQMRKIVSETPSTRQTLLFSATLDENAIGGIRDLVHDPATVEIAHKGTVAETIDQYVLPVSLDEKNGLLTKVLKSEGTDRVIVFTRTKHRADACCRRLRRAGIACAPIHGDRSQNQRERALRDFRDGKVDILVATDVLARGIDVSDVRYVVNFDVPEDPEDYIHRIGRTGRAGETGWALTFVTVNDAEDLFDIERLMGQVVPPYEAKVELELGEELPELDPNRTADAPARGAGKKRRKRGGKGRSGRGGEGRKREGRKDHETGDRKERAGRDAQTDRDPRESTPRGRRKIDATGALLSRGEIAELEAEASGKKRRRKGKGSGVRAQAPSGVRKGSSQRQGDAARRQKAAGGTSKSGKPASKHATKPTGKPRRRVGDRQGRERGIY